MRELWEYRELLYFLTWREIKVRYKQTVLGATWAIIQPLFTMLLFSLFFGKLAKVPSDRIPYPLFCLAGLVPWTFFANGLSQSSNSLVTSSNLISKVYFPRLAIPLSAVLSGAVDFTISFGLLVGMMAFYRQPPPLRCVYLPLFFLLAFVTALGVGLWLSALNVEYRDVRHTIPFLTQFWMFATPIVYPSSLLSEPWRAVYGLNPMAGRRRGFSLGSSRNQHCSRTHDRGFFLRGGVDPDRGSFLLSANGKNLCGCGVNYVRRRWPRQAFRSGSNMSDTAILVENLGKQYHISALQQDGGNYTYKSLRDSIANAASEPLRAARAMIALNGTREDAQDKRIWALKDVSFEVKRGEIVGVIGRNGAGKSTLLKLLARITEPTEGRAEIHGRTGSLLEVGTGFHPELSGRDNIFLNGSILGMKRAEIARQFDEIVAFAEVEDFIDTPVKHYSTGMYLRLAFAVAAHLETEVLLVDEVLAVGDYRFQEKCLGKMQDIAATGRTILFVSHSMSSIQRLCKRAIAISGGKLIADSSPEAVIAEYIGGNLGSTHAEPASKRDRLSRKLRCVLRTGTLTAFNGIPIAFPSGASSARLRHVQLRGCPDIRY